MKRINTLVMTFACFVVILLSACGGGGGDDGNAPSGVFSTKFVVPDPGCQDVGGVQVCGPAKVTWVEVFESSTGESLGLCDFGVADNVATAAGPGGYQFRCERSPGSAGSTTIMVTSKQANVLAIRASLVQDVPENALQIALTDMNSPSVTGPDGTVYSDPYERKEFQFAGVKEFHFHTTEPNTPAYFEAHALQPFIDAGYAASARNIQSTSIEVDVTETLDGRFELQEDVIEENWTVRAAETKGNKGVYDYAAGGEYQGARKYVGTAKASMIIPPPFNIKVWEITTDVTFEYDPSIDFGGGIRAFNTTGGTFTQTIYTGTQPGCTGTPASFTDTYQIMPNDGYLSLMPTGSPVEYNLSGSLSASTPIQAHTYQRCCAGMACTTETIEVGEQQHTWVYMNHEFWSAEADGSLRGTYTWQNGANTFEWNLTPKDN